MSPTREITEALAKANVLELSNTNLAERIKQVEATNKVASEHTVQWALSEQARADTLQQQNELARIEVQNKLIAAELATQEARSQSACWENIAKTAGSETMKLRSEVMQLQHEIDRQRNRLEILNRDNTTLNRDNTTLKRDNTTLKRDNTTLKATFSEQSRCFLQIRTLVDGCKSQPSLPASEDSDLIIVGERCIDASSDDASSDDASSDDAIEPHRTAATPGKRDRTRGPGELVPLMLLRNIDYSLLPTPPSLFFLFPHTTLAQFYCNPFILHYLLVSALHIIAVHQSSRLDHYSAMATGNVEEGGLGQLFVQGYTAEAAPRNFMPDLDCGDAYDEEIMTASDVSDDLDQNDDDSSTDSHSDKGKAPITEVDDNMSETQTATVKNRRQRRLQEKKFYKQQCKVATSRVAVDIEDADLHFHNDDVKLPDGLQLDMFRLRSSTYLPEYITIIQSAAEAYSEDFILAVTRLPLATGGQASVPMPETAADDQSGDWAYTETDLTECMTQPLDKNNTIWSYIGVDVYADEEGMTEEDKQRCLHITRATNVLGREVFAGISYPYSCIILHDDKRATFYQDNTIDRLATTPDAPISTVFRIHAYPHSVPYITVEYLVRFRQRQIPFISSIPFTAMKESPQVHRIESSQLRSYMQSRGLPCRQTRSASRVAFVACTDEIHVHHDRFAQADLSRAGFPDLNGIIQHITEQYRQEDLSFEVFIPSQWKDFGFWAYIMSTLYTTAEDDPLEEIRAAGTGHALQIYTGSATFEKGTDEGRDDEARPTMVPEDDPYGDTDEEDAGDPNLTERVPDGVPIDLQAALRNMRVEAGEELDEQQAAPSRQTNSKVLFIVQRNEHGERIAEAANVKTSKPVQDTHNYQGQQSHSGAERAGTQP
ncbi:hypothetical protein M406DRAFT_71445 [Cryphonectria parasitica EP155]|uniref:Uncharacterized protein n=1 Tax=Cryphonectria parasitica (strain ATCC 38755 / EP155) TaxID=660469 RepID=A0A9P4Y9B5_CRYP1|nr:uncharacterized protein M406DRAFT_71445 [Cryphonectria parasitica EP155]KAF3768435.1 hypothetical protein M406DRAFT_71445 [Cryphonectria parasitica EP155]